MNDRQGNVQAITWRATWSGAMQDAAPTCGGSKRKNGQGGLHGRIGLIDRSVLLCLGPQDRTACAST